MANLRLNISFPRPSASRPPTLNNSSWNAVLPFVNWLRKSACGGAKKWLIHQEYYRQIGSLHHWSNSWSIFEGTPRAVVEAHSFIYWKLLYAQPQTLQQACARILRCYSKRSTLSNKWNRRLLRFFISLLKMFTSVTRHLTGLPKQRCLRYRRVGFWSSLFAVSVVTGKGRGTLL